MSKRIVDDPSKHGWVEVDGKWVWGESGEAFGGGGLDSEIWTDEKAGYLDDNISTKAPASTALSTTTGTNAKADNLDEAISSRAPSSTALSTATWTNAKAASLDANISSRAPASTALSNTVWTDTRAGYLDNLAGGSLGGGYRPVASYSYVGKTSEDSNSPISATFDVAVSISNYQNCVALGAGANNGASGSRMAITYRPVSNSTVRVHYIMSPKAETGYAISVYRWG